MHACRLSLPGERNNMYVFVGTSGVSYLWEIKLNKLHKKVYYKMIVLAGSLIPLFSLSGITDSSEVLNQACWMMGHV